MIKECVLISYVSGDEPLANLLKQAIEDCFVNVVQVHLLLEPNVLLEGSGWLKLLDSELYHCGVIIGVSDDHSINRITLEFASWLADRRGTLFLSLRHGDDQLCVGGLINQIAANFSFASPEFDAASFVDRAQRISSLEPIGV